MSDGAPVETELARLLRGFPDHTVRELLTGIFDMAIGLHRAAGVEGYLGAPPSNPRVVSIILKRLFLCAVTRRRNLMLLVDNLPGYQERGIWRGFDLDPCPAARKQQLAWILCSLDDLATLESILTDGDVWRAYRRMLQRITDVKMSDLSETITRLSVLT
ncbi:MAG: hypothetical protein IT305_12765 [Chloroflexi bacterium]|nr:hypothetical protein [Chloroflexota bacterium]